MLDKRRADFVRVVSNLFTQTTKLAGQDSVFVKGSRIIYNSGVIADTALEPGETATYNFPVKIKNRRKANIIQWIFIGIVLIKIFNFSFYLRV
jgi:hypothetical protein